MQHVANISSANILLTYRSSESNYRVSFIHSFITHDIVATVKFKINFILFPSYLHEQLYLLYMSFNSTLSILLKIFSYCCRFPCQLLFNQRSMTTHIHSSTFHTTYSGYLTDLFSKTKRKILKLS
jgi:hypothetical protein